MKKPLFYGILASLFFAVTFVLNRQMNLSGGHFLWSASLRHVFMLPLLFMLVAWRHGLSDLWHHICRHPVAWLGWSTVGFGLFYLPLTFASDYGASWLVAGTWQLTIVAGALLSPAFGHKIPLKNLACSCVILAGVFLLQVEHVGAMDDARGLLVILPVLVAAFAYPLGNRKMMVLVGGKLSTMQRVLGMTLCSMPFWLVAMAFAGKISGAPSQGQLLSTFLVALFSGVVATLLFFEATNLVKTSPKQLAVVEATQSGEVVFTLLGGILFLQDALPSTLGLVGLGVIVIGMVLNSIYSS